MLYLDRLPPSDFLPDLILPDGNRTYTPSPTRGDRTPSPAATPPGIGQPVTYGNSMHNSFVNFSRTSPQAHHRLSIALSDIEEVDSTPRGSRYVEHKPEALASSPTIRENGAMDLVDWKSHSRRLSDGSSSVHSDELENMKWPGFDSAHGADVESVVLEEEEERYRDLPKVADSDDTSMLDDPCLGSRAGEEDDEDLLSKRADMILANAKKRLNVRAQIPIRDNTADFVTSLKEKAQEDRLKRLSVNSLRTPSPFTSSDKQHSDGYYKGASRSADWSQNSSPTAKQDEFSSPYYHSNSEPKSSPPRALDGTDYPESTYEDAEELLGDIKEEPEELDEPSTPSTTMYTERQKVLIGPHDPTPDELGDKDVSHLTAKAPFEDEYPEYEDSIEGDEESLDGQSEYHEALPVPAERHEDRADAFDYEHFFLHSAMGSFVRDRRGSSGSEDSLETTRPSSPPRLASVDHTSEDPQLLHRRGRSTESLSTVKSFATAAEEVNSDDEPENGPDPLDLATDHLFVPQIHAPPSLSPQSATRSARNSRHLKSEVHMPTSDDDSSDLDTDAGYTNSNVTQRPVSALVSSLLEIHNMVAGAEMKESDMELVEGVIKSLKNTCASLQSLAADDYERRVFRRRLDDARRALDG
ncbi:hypothetical protein FKW77_003732 [Venturia effusa]|uniref:Uncharacterized protein n=1 Tax=Venturia effusa TaxID=50376 RepID=A0A517LF73_9PEZI|nr:hypothetical protein FKW77_003732 [Venturia effusa]